MSVLPFQVEPAPTELSNTIKTSRCCGRRYCQPAYFFPCHSTRFLVCSKHIVHFLEPYARRALQHTLDHFRDAKERQSPFQKCCYGDLVGGIQCARQRATL